MAWIMGAQVGKSGDAPMARPYGVAILVFTCMHAAGFGWSWGPLGWLVPSELFPLEMRSAGQSVVAQPMGRCQVARWRWTAPENEEEVDGFGWWCGFRGGCGG